MSNTHNLLSQASKSRQSLQDVADKLPDNLPTDAPDEDQQPEGNALLHVNLDGGLITDLPKGGKAYTRKYEESFTVTAKLILDDLQGERLLREKGRVYITETVIPNLTHPDVYSSLRRALADELSERGWRKYDSLKPASYRIGSFVIGGSSSDIDKHDKPVQYPRMIVMSVSGFGALDKARRELLGKE